MASHRPQLGEPVTAPDAGQGRAVVERRASRWQLRHREVIDPRFVIREMELAISGRSVVVGAYTYSRRHQGANHGHHSTPWRMSWASIRLSDGVMCDRVVSRCTTSGLARLERLQRALHELAPA